MMTLGSFCFYTKNVCCAGVAIPDFLEYEDILRLDIKANETVVLARVNALHNF